jgi:hypothetical protein
MARTERATRPTSDRRAHRRREAELSCPARTTTPSERHGGSDEFECVVALRAVIQLGPATRASPAVRSASRIVPVAGERTLGIRRASSALPQARVGGGCRVRRRAALFHCAGNACSENRARLQQIARLVEFQLAAPFPARWQRGPPCADTSGMASSVVVKTRESTAPHTRRFGPSRTTLPSDTFDPVREPRFSSMGRKCHGELRGAVRSFLASG